MTDWRTLRWRCPHGCVHDLELPAARAHCQLEHADCLSCRAEALMLRSIVEGRGQHWFGTDPFDLFSKPSRRPDPPQRPSGLP